MRNLALGFFLIAASLMGCGVPEQTLERPAASPDEVMPPSTSIGTLSEVASLAGEWRVAGIDGRSVDEPVGLLLTGNGEQLWWQPRCAGMARTYRIEGRNITFGSTESPRPAGAPTPPVCAIGLPPRLDEVFRALDSAVNISRTASNGVLIAGPDHSLMLFSQ